MGALQDLLGAGLRSAGQKPWPAVIVDGQRWTRMAEQLSQGAFTLSALWGEPGTVHAALLEEVSGRTVVVSLACPGGRFPSIGRLHPPALRLERAIHDLVGLVADGAPDMRPWLDHGRWDVRHPVGYRLPACDQPYEFLPASGEGVHQIAVGPVHAGVIEPGHFRFNVNGETIVRLEERLGYAHKGVEALMAGTPPDRAARLAGRVSGDSTVAYAIAFARAVEAALVIEAPARAHWLRGLMAELERLANHLGDIGAICNDAAFALMQAHCAILREHVLRISDRCFGHRLLQDCVVPGGMSVDLNSKDVDELWRLLDGIARPFSRLVELYDNTASLQERVAGTGSLDPFLVRQYAAGGYVGRASGRAFDVRRVLAYPPYDQLHFEVPLLTTGDVNARVWIRIREVEQSMALIKQILKAIPGGPIKLDLPSQAGEGLAMVEGFRGDILVWLRLDALGLVERCHLRDPSWFQWPLLEAAITGNIVADFPLCNKSFNCSYSGHDL